MAVTIDWATRVISIPQADLTHLGGTSYQLDTDWFRLQLKDLEDSEAGIPMPDTHRHNTQVLLGGISYARIIEIINGYTITFENGSYTVSLVGSNNNILDVTNLNSVQVASNNSAGLINVTELQHDAFGGAVTVDATSSYSGTLYPTGTPLQPVNNIPDAMSIASFRGFDTINIIGNFTFDSGDDISYMKVAGQNAILSTLTINDAALTVGAEITGAYIQGNLDGGTLVERCVIDGVNYINGFVHKCMLAPGTIYLGGANVANFLDCYSGVPGQGTPTLDCNGLSDDQATPLAMRGYHGGIKLVGLDGGAAVSIDLNSGQVIVDTATCTNGNITVRGAGKLVDQNGEHIQTGTYGSLNVYNEVGFGTHIHEMWQLMGLDDGNPMTVTPTSRTAGNISQTISGDGETTSTVTRT